ncbi:MAG: Cof-type HAD-IIB family hydrolase [Lachnospiraceae bacterium]|nr:Cof-type HAD-IIB family hydrolase [Lachnospiraceae bacterium]
MTEKLVCFDVDGTLLCDDKHITKENIAAVHKALDLGHKAAIVTGRSLRGTRMVVDELDFRKEGCYLLSFQGNVIYDLATDEIIHEDGVEAGKMISLLKDLNANDIYAHTFDYDSIITTKDTKELQRYNRIAIENVEFIKDWDELKNPTYPKIIAIEYSDLNKLPEYQKRFFDSEQSKEFDCFFSSRYFLEFCKKDSNKGTGVEALAKYLNIPRENVIAIGDERNDISMIQYANVGCAMANAHADVKEIADYITANNNNYSGVAEVIEKYLF